MSDFGQHLIDKYNEKNTSVKVQRIHRFDNTRRLKANVNVIINDALLIRGIRVISGISGLHVLMPEAHNEFMIQCLTQELKDQITQTVLEAYNEE